MDYGLCFLFDEMHGIDLGVAKKVMCAWLKKNKPYSLSDEQVSLERMLIQGRLNLVLHRSNQLNEDSLAVDHRSA